MHKEAQLGGRHEGLKDFICHSKTCMVIIGPFSKNSPGDSAPLRSCYRHCGVNSLGWDKGGVTLGLWVRLG